jgi:hypothetical protein
VPLFIDQIWKIFLAKWSAKKALQSAYGRNILRKLLFFGSVADERPSYTTKPSNFPSFFRPLFSYERWVIFLNSIFHGLSFGIKFIGYLLKYEPKKRYFLPYCIFQQRSFTKNRFQLFPEFLITKLNPKSEKKSEYIFRKSVKRWFWQGTFHSLEWIIHDRKMNKHLV